MARRTRAHDERRGLEELLLLSGRGDTEAFAGVYDELAPRVHGLATRMLRDPAAAEVATVEAFVATWHRAPSYDPTASSAAGWVLALAHEVLVRNARRARSEAEHVAEEAATQTAEQLLSDTAPLLAAGLSQAQARAVGLTYFDGLEHRQVAERLDCSEAVPSLVTDGLVLLASGTSPR